MKFHSLSIASWLLGPSQLVIASSFQKPLLDSLPKTHSISNNYWKFNYSSPAPHFFASVYGLLQQWPNTFFPNGHSIAPCEIPPFTKLYHGRVDGDLPPSPEWVAFDIEMSYGIMGGSRNSHMLTYQTTRVAKCIYFDGESAALFGSGQLDTQMLHVFGNVTGPPSSPGTGFRGLWQEYARAIGLCDWLEEKKLGGLGWGFEGIVRMNAGFEMIWCNFSSPSIRLISHLNVTAPLLPPTDEKDEMQGYVAATTSYYPLPPSSTRSDKATDPSDPPAPPNWRFGAGREPFLHTQAWNWFASSTAHYGSNGAGPGLGETRVKITSCGFLNYYSPKFESAAASRTEQERKSLNLTSDGLWIYPYGNATRKDGLIALMRRRRAHTLEATSEHDAAKMKADSERVLGQIVTGDKSCSGMDWTLVTNEIVQENARPLDVFLRLLQGRLPNMNQSTMKEWMTVVRGQSHTFLLPFLQYSNGSLPDYQYNRNSKLFNNTYARCRFHHTRLLDPEEGISLGPEELILKSAVEETTSGICNILVDIGLSIEGLWQSMFNVPTNATTLLAMSSIDTEVRRWTEGLEELMAWLGWAGEWTSCEKKCEWNEKCFIPMWPLLNMGGGPGYRRPGYGGPYYGPGYGGPPPHLPPMNDTGPPGGFGRWQPDDSDLWQPRCVKYDYFSR